MARIMFRVMFWLWVAMPFGFNFIPNAWFYRISTRLHLFPYDVANLISLVLVAPYMLVLFWLIDRYGSSGRHKS